MRECLGDEIPHRRFVVDDEDARPIEPVAAERAAMAGQPGLDIFPPEPPLPANAQGRDAAALDQPVDGPWIDLEDLFDLLGRQEWVVTHRGTGTPGQCTTSGADGGGRQ